MKPREERQWMGSGTREWRVVEEVCPAMRLCGVRWAGYTFAAAGYEFVREDSPFAGVIMTCDGEGEVLVEGAWQTLARDHAYVLPSGATHAYRQRGKRIWHICWVALRTCQAQPAVPGILESDHRPLLSSILGLRMEWNQHSDGNLVLNWLELVRGYAQRLIAATALDGHLARLWELVDSDCGRPWTIENMASEMAVSREQLRRQCARELRCTPMQQVRRLRLQRAASLLVSTDQKVAVIAASVGYHNPFAFATLFRKQMGVPPAEYRRCSLASGM